MDLIWAIAVSSHLGMEGNYNSIHPHVRFVQNGAIAGAYYNSEERISFYGGYRLEPSEKTGIEFAIATGYEEFGAIAPYARGTYDMGKARFFVAPGFEKNNNETNIGVVLGIELQLK
jgi:hypothetical protein